MLGRLCMRDRAVQAVAAAAETIKAELKKSKAALSSLGKAAYFVDFL